MVAIAPRSAARLGGRPEGRCGDRWRGYLGLSAALRLRRAGCEVALLEQSFCGAGASGRNAGHLTPTIGKDVYTCLRQWGVERGLALAAFAEAAVDATEARIAALNIDCDYVGNGNIVAGLHPAHRKPLEAAAAAMSAAGLPTSFLEDRDLRARGLPRAFRFGLLERRGDISIPENMPVAFDSPP
uniref:FAD-binding oxidoreductase n=1 Tax=Phenylobacterium glaciei TaxID=2803784 RepID=A0A974P6G2_9CAUL|nr:FAD-binding oxidoreductase [Phenylobacterium glaciei]